MMSTPVKMFQNGTGSLGPPMEFSRSGISVESVLRPPRNPASPPISFSPRNVMRNPPTSSPIPLSISEKAVDRNPPSSAYPEPMRPITHTESHRRVVSFWIPVSSGRFRMLAIPCAPV